MIALTMPLLLVAALAQPSGRVTDDTRFGEIGRPGPDPNAPATPPPTVGLATNRVGHVTYGGLRVDVPSSAYVSLIPQAALLHIAPYAPSDPTVIVPYLGGGLGVRPAHGWSAEASILYGPRTHGIESVSAIAAVARELGADWAHDVPPPLALQLAGGWNRFRWASGEGPAGPTLSQLFVQAEALFRATPRFHVAPRAMAFVYDRPLSSAVGPRLGTISVLAQVGVYAPRLMGGGRVGYLVGGRVFPFVDAQRIRYAEDVGNGTQVAFGLKLLLGRQSSVTALGGALWNDVHGPLVPTTVNLARVPVFGVELELAL